MIVVKIGCDLANVDLVHLLLLETLFELVFQGLIPRAKVIIVDLVKLILLGTPAPIARMIVFVIFVPMAARLGWHHELTLLIKGFLLQRDIFVFLCTTLANKGIKCSTKSASSTTSIAYQSRRRILMFKSQAVVTFIFWTRSTTKFSSYHTATYVWFAIIIEIVNEWLIVSLRFVFD